MRTNAKHLNRRDFLGVSGTAAAVSGELAGAAERHGLTKLEAAAYERLGVALI